MIVGITMVRDEADVISFTLAHLAAEGIDHFIVADNGSSDATRAHLEKFRDHGPVPLTILDDPEVGYYQAKKMSLLARRAHDLGASWVFPFDADELWYSPDGRTCAEVLAEVEEDKVYALEYKHWPTGEGLEVLNPFVRLQWRDTAPAKLRKVVFRSHPDAELHMGNHDVTRPGAAVRDVLEMRHFPYRSLAQFKRKVRNGRQAYEQSNLHVGYGTHWRQMGALSDDDLDALWAETAVPEGVSHAWLGHGELVHDPAPFRP